MNKEQRDDKGRLVKGHELRLQSGAWLFLRSGRIPSIRGRRRLQKHLNDLRARLMEVVPNSEDPRREVIISQVIKCEGFCLLLEEYLKRAGILDPVAFKAGRLETQGSMVMIISLLNTQQRALNSLGMDSKALEAIKAPYEIVAEQEKSK